MNNGYPELMRYQRFHRDTPGDLRTIILRYAAEVHNIVSRRFHRVASLLQEAGGAGHGTGHRRTAWPGARSGDELDRADCEAHGRQYAFAMDRLLDQRRREARPRPR